MISFKTTTELQLNKKIVLQSESFQLSSTKEKKRSVRVVYGMSKEEDAA